MKKALTAYEDINMYGGAHCTNYDVAKKAAAEGRDLIVHRESYDGQRYHSSVYRVTNLHETEDGRIVGTIVDADPYCSVWEATSELCEYALTGRI